MRIDIWSDIVCPFCYVGKRNLEQALAEFEHRDEVERWCGIVLSWTRRLRSILPVRCPS